MKPSKWQLGVLQRTTKFDIFAHSIKSVYITDLDITYITFLCPEGVRNVKWDNINGEWNKKPFKELTFDFKGRLQSHTIYDIAGLLEEEFNRRKKELFQDVN